MQTCVLLRNLIGTTRFCRFRMASSTSVGGIQPKLYVVQYDYVADALEKRKPYREAHLSHIGKQVELGNVILGGAVDHPPTGALLILRNLTAGQIEELVKNDPYFINGVVKNYAIKPYIAVAGDALLNNDLIKI